MKSFEECYADAILESGAKDIARCAKAGRRRMKQIDRDINRAFLMVAVAVISFVAAFVLCVTAY